MVLLALPPADHLLIERDRGQFVPSRRRRMMANVRAERLLEIPVEPSPELRIPGAAAQTRVVSLAGIRLDSRKSVRPFKGIICDDISEFESHMPSHAVGLSASLLVSAGGVFRPVRSMVKGEKPGDLPVQQTVKFELVNRPESLSSCRN